MNMSATRAEEVRELARLGGIALAQIASEMRRSRTWLSLALGGERPITSVQLAEVLVIIDRLVQARDAAYQDAMQALWR